MGELVAKGGSDEASVEQGGRVGQGEAQSQQAVQQSSLHTDKARKFKVKREGESIEQQHKIRGAKAISLEVRVVVGVDIFLVSPRDEFI